MARRKRIKRKRMTITEQYNRYATGLEYFGESFETKKRATSKGLKELKKHYYKLRKELREQGMVDLPTIAQAEKEILRQRAEEAQEYRVIDDDLEELPYMEGSLENESYSYSYIAEFKAIIEMVLEATNIVPYNPSFGNAISATLTEVYAKLLGSIEAYGEDYVEDYLANSSDLESLRKNTYGSYDEVKQGVSDIKDLIEAMISEMRGEL